MKDAMTLPIMNKRNLGKTLGLAGTLALLTTPLVGVGRAQPQASSTITFEAASVKPNNSADMRATNWQFLPGGRFTATNLPLFAIIALAYNVPFQSPRLSGGPDWIRSAKYDIQATAGVGAIPIGISIKSRDDKIRSMLQNLLADRFKLVVRRDTSVSPVYAVVVAKLGPRLKKSGIEEKDCPEVAIGAFTGSSCHSVIGGQGRGLHGKAVAVADMVAFAENWSDRPIVDKTGIEGLFEVDTEGWVPVRPRIVPPGREPTAEDIAAADPTRPTLFMIFARLGLKMESQKALVETFVIDQIERPTEN